MTDPIEEKIVHLIRDKVMANGAEFGSRDKEISISTRLAEVGLDSLDLTELLWELEEDFGISIELNTADAWSNLNSIGDLVEAVRALTIRENNGA
ncbi:phosphopantetheine-binding protein [Rhizobium grahamii]|uniref:Nodulation protein NodF n=1 Tax=Rhizobium grahamii TaxID=1120045 RepID=A0A370KED1_9HYPH|nr:phosphopantetheine-binding protein [Rhizobium grahamii]RDJ02017.1 nodulation protein NodF [Rhizobium grahamii]